MNRLDAYAVTLGGLHLIEASAGTGKTHAISTLYLRAVVELGLLPEQILVVTFTRAATGELGERIRARLRQAHAGLLGELEGDVELTGYLGRQSSRADCLARIERALLAVDQAAVMTIHGFCSRVLEQNAFENRIPFDTDLVESLEELLQEIVNDFMLAHVASRPYPELLALRAIGLDAARLLALAKTVCRGDRLRFEPELDEHEGDLSAAIDGFEQQRIFALAWLRDELNRASLAGLNKKKPREGIGKRLEGLAAKSERWLSEPFYCLKAPCQAFESLFELADKNPVAKTQRLLDWFGALERCSASFEALRLAMLRRGVRLQLEFVDFFVREFERRKQAKAVQSYDDLLRRLRDTLLGGGGPALIRQLRQRYPLALIDEFQDTDPVQFEVFSRIYREAVSLFIIGDPKQSIYAFRGADVDSYLHAKLAPGVHVHTLDVNWRSDPRVLAGLETLYRTHPDPFVSAGIDFTPVTPRPHAEDLRDARGASLSGVRLLVDIAGQDAAERLPKYRARRAAMDATAEYVASLLTTRPATWTRTVRASEIAVLVRTNRECLQTAAILGSHGIRCVQTSESSVLESDAAASLRTLLRALHAPGDTRRLVALLVDELLGFEPYEVEQLRDDVDGWERWVQRLANYRRIWERSGALSVVVGLCNELDLKPRLLGRLSGERFITDILHSAELVQAAAREQHLSLEAQIEWLERGSRAEGGTYSEAQQLRIEADSDAVLVTTVHRAKGLQFPFVICPFFWIGSARRPGATLAFRRRSVEPGRSVDVVHLEPKLLERDADEFQSAEVDLRREEARLLYVALTRAKHQVALLWVDAQGSEVSPLFRLLCEEARSPNLTARAGTRDDLARPKTGWRNALHEAQASGVIDVLSLHDLEPRAPVASSAEQSVPLLAPRALERVIAPTLRTTSYSALTATSMLHVEVGRDVDALTLSESAELEPRAGTRSAPPIPLLLADLPRGAKTGEALHAILEAADFQSFGQKPSTPEVSVALERFGLDPALYEAPIRCALRGVLDLQLLEGHERLRLCNVARESRRSELEFIMKVSSLNVERLASSLGTSVSGVSAEYRQELERLRFDPVTGYLRGFVDLVFELDGRYYIVDYKSNTLGDTIECYSRPRIEEEMRRHHYPVQAAIYAAAVDRWLRVARSDYDYETHFGGIFYLFLRGMVPELGPASGIFHHRPSLEGIRDFETMLEGRKA